MIVLKEKIQNCVHMMFRQQQCSLKMHSNILYRHDTCFDAHLFRRLFCLYHVMLCARSDDITACFFVCK